VKDKKETTKEKLIKAGTEAFAANGFEGTTTRSVAEKAGCNLAAIPYYFGSKKGLYLAVFERFTDLHSQYLNHNLEAARAFLEKGDRDPETALGYLKQLIGAMVEFSCSRPPNAPHHQLIIREQLNPSSAFDILYKKVIRRELDVISRLIAAITGENDHRTTTFKAFILLGQVMTFHHGRQLIVRHLGLHGYSDAETGEIRQLIIAWIDKALKPDQTDSTVRTQS